MKNILFICLIILSNVVLGQSVNSLDLKNGFRNFKLGTSPSQIQNIVKQTQQFSKNLNVAEYEYVGNDINNVFNVNVNSVSLSFYKNKLFSIRVSFGKLAEAKDFELYEFSSILSALENTYGSNWIKPTNEDGIILNGAIWDAKNVKCELLRVDFSKSYSNPKDYGFVSGYIHIIDKKLMNQMYASDF